MSTFFQVPALVLCSRSSRLLSCLLPAARPRCAGQRGPTNTENAVSAHRWVSRMAMATRPAARDRRKGDLSRRSSPEAPSAKEAGAEPGSLRILSKALSVLTASQPNQAEYFLFASRFSYRSYRCWIAPHSFGRRLRNRPCSAAILSAKSGFARPIKGERFSIVSAD